MTIQPTLEELEREADEILSKASKTDDINPDDISKDADDAEPESEDSAKEPENEPDKPDEDSSDDGDDTEKSVDTGILDGSMAPELDGSVAPEAVATAVIDVFAKSLADVMENISDSKEYSETSAAVLAKSLRAQNVILSEQNDVLAKTNRALATLQKSIMDRLDELDARLDEFGAQPAHMRKSVAAYTDRNFAESVGGPGAGRPTLTKSQVTNILTNELLSGSTIVTDQDVINNEAGVAMRPEVRELIESKIAR